MNKLDSSFSVAIITQQQQQKMQRKTTRPLPQNSNDRIAQWISAFDFGSKGRGFDSHCGRCILVLTLYFLMI